MLPFFFTGLQSIAAEAVALAPPPLVCEAVQPPQPHGRLLHLSFKAQAGFSLIELMIVLAITAILAGIGAPSLQDWMRIYRIRSAAMDLYSNMQLTRLSAVKTNRPWKMRFHTSTKKYEIIRCLTTACEGGTLNTDYQIPKTLLFSDKYKKAVQYKSPNTDPAVDFGGATMVTFNPDGTTSAAGYVRLSNDTSTGYYRVGFQYITGAARVQKWNGTAWE